MIQPFREILYTSVIAHDQPSTVVARILATARAANAKHGITGLMVFDGMRFFEHLEGEPGAVATLMTNIAHDRRHEGLRVIYEGGLDQRRYRAFLAGYAEPDELESEAAAGDLLRLHGAAALARFMAMQARFDIQI